MLEESRNVVSMAVTGLMLLGLYYTLLSPTGTYGIIAFYAGCLLLVPFGFRVLDIFCFVPRIVLVNLYATYCGHDQLPTPADTPSDFRYTEVRVSDESTPLKYNLSQSYHSGD